MSSDRPLDLLDSAKRIMGQLVSSVDSGDGSFLDSAAESFASMLNRWARNPSLRRFVGGIQRDVVASAGELVELSALLPVPLRGHALARFHVGDVLFGEQAIEGRSELRVVKPAPVSGLHLIRVDIVSHAGEVIASLPGRRVLQVVSGRPVAMVDANLLLAEGAVAGELMSALRELSEPFELVYFDIHEKNREEPIGRAIHESGLPRAAVVVYSAEEQELASLGVDFVRMFASTAIRRLRANGVPVTTMLSQRDVEPSDESAAKIRVLTPAAALSRLGQDGIAEEQKFAEELRRRKSQASRLNWRLDQMTGSTLSHGNTFHAELDNKRARERLLAAIDGARSSIHMQVYIVRPSQFAELLVVHLIRRARAGVHVRFMVDALYSEEAILGRLNPLIRSLRDEPNIEVLAVAPIASPMDVSVTKLKKRDHRKLVVVDGERAFVSGRNAGDEYFLSFEEVPVHDQTPHERIPWLDAHVEIDGPLVHAVQKSFIDTWHGHGGSELEVEPEPERQATGGVAGRLVLHHGFRDMNGLAMYEALFDSAEHHAYIVNDFPFVPALERAVKRLLAQGVVVKILTGSASARRNDGTFFPAPAHRAAFEYLVKAKLEPLMEAGAEVYEFMPPESPIVVSHGGRIRPYVHAKIVSVDGAATSIGSANLDGTASYWESEANVVVQDQEFARGVERELEQLIQGSLRLDLNSEYWKSERAKRAVVATLWPGSLYS